MTSKNKNGPQERQKTNPARSTAEEQNASGRYSEATGSGSVQADESGPTVSEKTVDAVKEQADSLKKQGDRAAQYVKHGTERAAEFVKDHTQRAADVMKSQGGAASAYAQREMSRPIPAALGIIAVIAFLFAGYFIWTSGADAPQAGLSNDAQVAMTAQTQERLAALQRDIAEIRNRAQQARADVAEIRSDRVDVAALQSEIDAQKEQIAGYRRQLEEAKREAKNARAEAHTLREQVAELTNQNKAATAQLASLRESGIDLTGLSAISAQLETARGQLAKAQAELSDLQQSLKTDEAKEPIGSGATTAVSQETTAAATPQKSEDQ